MAAYRRGDHGVGRDLTYAATWNALPDNIRTVAVITKNLALLLISVDYILRVLPYVFDVCNAPTFFSCNRRTINAVMV